MTKGLDKIKDAISKDFKQSVGNLELLKLPKTSDSFESYVATTEKKDKFLVYVYENEKMNILKI